MLYSKGYIDSNWLNLLLLMGVPLIGYLGNSICVKFLESEGIVGAISNLVIRSKISQLNKPMSFTTSTIDHKMIPTPPPSIWIRRSTQISFITILFLVLTTLHRIMLTLLVFNMGSWSSTLTTSTSNVQFSELNEAFHWNSSKEKWGSWWIHEPT